MMATPQMTAAIAAQVAGATFSPKQKEGEQRRDQRHTRLHQQDVGDGRIGERHDEGGRAVAKQSPTASPGKPMSRKSFSVPRPPSRTA